MIAATPKYIDATDRPKHKISPMLKKGLLTWRAWIFGFSRVMTLDPASPTMAVNRDSKASGFQNANR